MLHFLSLFITLFLYSSYKNHVGVDHEANTAAVGVQHCGAVHAPQLAAAAEAVGPRCATLPSPQRLFARPLCTSGKIRLNNNLNAFSHAYSHETNHLCIFYYLNYK